MTASLPYPAEWWPVVRLLLRFDEQARIQLALDELWRDERLEGPYAEHGRGCRPGTSWAPGDGIARGFATRY